jgi:hypothetical protein
VGVASKPAEQLLTTLEGLPEKDVPIVIHFIEFLKWSERQRWADFDRWAMELAQEKGFSQLTEDKVAQIVHEYRKETP